ADTATMNPQVDKQEIEQAYRDDPSSAAAEFGAEFRGDLESFVDREILEKCVTFGCHERVPIQGMQHYGFLDAAGGSGTDSMALSVGHREKDGVVVVDAIRERRPPFSPSEVVAEFSETLKSYGIVKIVSDKWGGDWPGEKFREHNVGCEVAAR